MRCAFRGYRNRLSGGRWTKDPYRCESDGEWQDPDVPGDWYCPKHARLVQRRGF